MRRFKGLLVAAVLTVFSASLFAADATVTFVSGKVEVQRNGKWVALQKGDTVAKSETISTGFQSEAKIKMMDSVMYLGPVTRITLEELSTTGKQDNVNVYLQSQNNLLKNLAFKASIKTNFSQLRAIYGFENSTNIAHVQAPLFQVADILLPQIEEFGGPKKVVVPVGIDQDPHIRLTRDIAHKLNEEEGFISPASTYHRFLTGLTGDKMSSSKPATAIYLNDDTKTAVKKVKSAKTGGRETLKEQEELGGEVDKCVIYEMLLYHFIDDDSELEKIRQDCLNGTLRCGECKLRTAELMEEFMDDLHEKQVEAREVAKTLI